MILITRFNIGFMMGSGLDFGMMNGVVNGVEPPISNSLLVGLDSAGIYSQKFSRHLFPKTLV